MIADAGCLVLLTQKQLAAQLPSLSIPVVTIDAGDAIAAEEYEPRGIINDPQQAAYVIDTSGSTGQPKGVVVTHANVTLLLGATEASFSFTANDVWTMFHSSA